MVKDLQEISFDETQDTINVEVKFRIAGQDVDIGKINKLMGIKPTLAWTKGDEYVGKQYNTITKKREAVTRIRRESLWELSTKEYTKDLKIEAHIEKLWGLIGNYLGYFSQMKGEGGRVSLTLIKNSKNEVIDYEIRPEFFLKIIVVCDNVLFINNHSQSDKDII